MSESFLKNHIARYKHLHHKLQHPKFPIFFCILLVVCVVLGLTATWIATQPRLLKQKISEQKRLGIHLLEEKRQLERLVSQHQGTVEQRAQQELGMQYPDVFLQAANPSLPAKKRQP